MSAAVSCAEAEAVGVQAARLDYDGGYRTLPTLEATEGCVFPTLKQRWGVTDRRARPVAQAVRAYREHFLQLLAHPPRAPRAARRSTGLFLPGAYLGVIP